MATKTYCDGCDKELRAGSEIQNITVSVKKNGEICSAGGAYELCKHCAADLVGQANPKSWVRSKPEAV